MTDSNSPPENGTPADSADPLKKGTDAPKQTKRQIIIENVKSLGWALLIVLAIRSSVIEAFKIPSGSMIPTLFVGDHIFVSKFAYGIAAPFYDFIMGKPFYLVKFDPPKHGDIIVFRYPRDESLHYIKRVVGVPGDVIEIRDKVLYINNKMIARDALSTAETERILGPLDQSEYRADRNELYMEHLDGKDHFALIDKDSFMAQNQVPITVPKDHLFVMGDNRDRSNDSRFWGFVPYENVKGKALFIWLSLCVGFSECPKLMHPERIGTILK